MTGQTEELERFVIAQQDIYQQALAELRAGRKTSHWMWFIFPQIEGLGSSPMAQRYAIRSAEEGRAYLAHPLLGPRLRECTEAVNAHQYLSATAIFGTVDAMKLKSSMTLFDYIAPHDELFGRCLAQYFDSIRDQRTLDILSRQNGVTGRSST